LARELPGGKFAFPEAAESRGSLQGRVLWDEADDERLQKTGIVRVFVNGFQQLPAILKPAAAGVRERAFQADILLNRKDENQVVLTLPDLVQDTASRTRFTISCRHPEKAQRLHLVAVSLQEKDREHLKQKLLEALQCSTGANGEPQLPTFESVHILPPLTGYYVNGPSVYEKLRRIQAEVNGLVKAGSPPMDLVVFYYQGREAINAQGTFYLPGGSRPDEPADAASLSCDDLVSLFSRTPGAHILLFDVDRGRSLADGARDLIAGWEDNYGDFKHNITALRYAWLGQSEHAKTVHLLEGLRQAIPQASRLIEVANQLRQIAAGSPYYRKELTYDQVLPSDMSDILLSQHD
jgi:hypothetical protein